MIDLYPSILQNSSKPINLFAMKKANLQAQILPISPENPLGIDGYAFNNSERIPLNPSGFLKANNLYIFHKWKISHNLENSNLSVYSIGLASWQLYLDGVPLLNTAIAFSDTDESELVFAFKPNTNNPRLEIAFNALLDASSPDFLNLNNGVNLGIRFSVYEVSSDKIINSWLERNDK